MPVACAAAGLDPAGLWQPQDLELRQPLRGVGADKEKLGRLQDYPDVSHWECLPHGSDGRYVGGGVFGPVASPGSLARLFRLMVPPAPAQPLGVGAAKRDAIQSKLGVLFKIFQSRGNRLRQTIAHGDVSNHGLDLPRRRDGVSSGLCPLGGAEDREERPELGVYVRGIEPSDRGRGFCRGPASSLIIWHTTRLGGGSQPLLLVSIIGSRSLTM